MIVSVDVEAGLPPGLARRLADASDLAVLMAYAQHSPANEPGPLAAAGWLDSTIARLGPSIGADKLVLGIGNYGLDWPAGGRAAGLTFEGALMAARNN